MFSSAVFLQTLSMAVASVGILSLLWQRLYYRKALQQHAFYLQDLKQELAQKSYQAESLQLYLHHTEKSLEKTREEILRLSAQNKEYEVTLKHERTHLEQQTKALEHTEQKLLQAFKALSYEALQANSASFMQLAQTSFDKLHQSAQQDLNGKHTAIAQLVKPLQESLQAFDTKVVDLDKNRHTAYEVLRHQVKELIYTQKELKQETHKLVSALKTPTVRGRWGEIQLKRVVEMAGMLAHCDFLEQPQVSAHMRPDMIIRLPGNKQMVVDAKTPLAAYLEAQETPDEAQKVSKLQEHARHVRNHIQALSGRGYWEQFGTSLEFVILFLPGEAFFSAALEQDPSLIEQGVEQRVILATPTTLIALLRAVAYGWRQEHLTQNVHAIGQLGRELYKRLGDMSEYFNKMGRHLNGTIETYNQLVGNVERRVLVSARRFKELEGVEALPEIEPLSTLEIRPKSLSTLAPTRNIDMSLKEDSALEETHIDVRRVNTV